MARTNFTTPVGRLVMGSLYKPQTTDADGKPLVRRAAVPPLAAAALGRCPIPLLARGRRGQVHCLPQQLCYQARGV